LRIWSFTCSPNRRMKLETQGMLIPLQVGTELRITNKGDVIVDNPEVELAMEPDVADAVLSYRFDANSGQHVLKLLEPVVLNREP
jgi:hypothetical protein